MYFSPPHTPIYGSTNLLSTLYSSRGRQATCLPEEDTNYANNPYSADLQVNAIDIMKNGGERKSRTEKFTGKLGVRFHDFVKGLTVDVNASRRADYYNYENDGRTVVSMGRNGVIRGSGAAGSYAANSPNFNFFLFFFLHNSEKTRYVCCKMLIIANTNSYPFTFNIIKLYEGKTMFYEEKRRAESSVSLVYLRMFG